MTVYGLIASIAWAALAAFVVLRAEKIAFRWLDMTDPVKRASAMEIPPIPDDLMAIAMQEDAGGDEATKAARQGVVDAIRERWRLYKNWNKVRSAMGVAEVSV